MGKRKMGDKLLSFIGLEPTDEGLDDQYYDDEDIQDDMMGGFPEDEYIPPVEEKRINKKKGETAKMVGVPDTSKVRVLIYKPVSYEDTQSIIDNLKERKPIIVNLDELDTDVAQRILDFVSGAVYALNGNIRKAARNIFVVAPYNVDVSTNTAEAASDEFGFGYLERE
ncbi:MAG: cell division protein SepF [Christensenella sp.]|nr:cell division protein SepF [Christensenella sp.]